MSSLWILGARALVRAPAASHDELRACFDLVYNIEVAVIKVLLNNYYYYDQ